MLRKRLENVQSTLRALKYAWHTEYSIRLQMLASATVAFCGLWFHISLAEWAPVVMALGLVLAVELVNTSIENVCDTVHPDYNPHIGIAKDLAGSASLIVGVIATFVSISTFLPYL